MNANTGRAVFFDLHLSFFHCLGPTFRWHLLDSVTQRGSRHYLFAGHNEIENLRLVSFTGRFQHPSVTLLHKIVGVKKQCIGDLETALSNPDYPPGS
jgi:hypothetical protein